MTSEKKLQCIAAERQLSTLPLMKKALCASSVNLSQSFLKNKNDIPNTTTL